MDQVHDALRRLSVSEQEAAGAEFVRLGQEDIENLLSIETRCFPTPWNRKQFELGIKQKAFHVFGFKKDAALLAYVSFYKVEDEMEILNIAVRPESRRLGLGSRMLSTVLQIGSRMGIGKVYLEVRRGNEAARQLYAKHGFLAIGVRPKYYRDTGEDAILMRAEISSITSS
jgi:[ribosomal protein S18]-alanine N-acetyltransferase